MNLLSPHDSGPRETRSPLRDQPVIWRWSDLSCLCFVEMTNETKTTAARTRLCLRCEERVWYHSFQFHWPPLGVHLLHSWRDDGVWSSPPCCQSMHRVCPAINHDTHTSCPRIKPHYTEKSCIFTGGDLFIVSPQFLSSPEQQLEVWARPTHTMSQQCLSLLRWQDNRSCRCSWCI